MLLTKNNIVKLCDLGLAVNLSNDVGKELCGTPAYMSPELSRGRQFDEQLEYQTHTVNTDIW